MGIFLWCVTNEHRDLTIAVSMAGMLQCCARARRARRRSPAAAAENAKLDSCEILRGRVDSLSTSQTLDSC